VSDAPLSLRVIGDYCPSHPGAYRSTSSGVAVQPTLVSKHWLLTSPPRARGTAAEKTYGGRPYVQEGTCG
jgi:hypothetical protein